MRRLLKRPAKTFASFECHTRTWHELKRGLIKKFSKKINSRQVHQLLRETKQRNDEACLAYMYRMLEITSLVDMEEEAKVDHIIDGIVDEESVTIGALQIRWTDDGDKDVANLATMYIAEVPNESSISQRSFHRMF